MNKLNKSNKSNTRSTSSRALIKRVLQSVKGTDELKILDTNYSSVSISSTGIIYPITLISAGTGNNNRVGLKISPQRLYANFTISHNLVSPSEIIFTRLIHFIDLQQVGGAYPVVTDLLTSNLYYSTFNVNTFNRFKILSDKLFATDQYNQTILYKFSKKLHGEVRYQGGNTTDISKNGHYMLAISNQAIYFSFLDGNNRLSFTDS